MEIIKFKSEAARLVWIMRRLANQDTHNRILPKDTKKLCDMIESFEEKLAVVVNELHQMDVEPEPGNYYETSIVIIREALNKVKEME